MGIVLLWATWAHEYKAIFVKIDGHRTSGVVATTKSNGAVFVIKMES